MNLLAAGKNVDCVAWQKAEMIHLFCLHLKDVKFTVTWIEYAFNVNQFLKLLYTVWIYC